jgi:uncharacterized membrane protein YpjA
VRETDQHIETPLARWQLWARFARWLVASSWLVWFLVVVLLGSAVSGYLYWYGPFAATAPWYLWIFVPDSPLSVALMAGALVALHFRRRWELLCLLASWACIKYGLWTDFIWFMNSRSGGHYDFIAGLMSISHFGMVVLGLAVAVFVRYRPVPVLVASLFFVTNDVVDYVFGYYPPLPDPQDLVAISWFAVGTTSLLVCWGMVSGWAAVRRKSRVRM